LLYRTSLCSNVAGKARPLSVIHGIMSTILLIFSNSLDDADKWHPAEIQVARISRDREKVAAK
jgi:hypothetical protein